MSGGARPAIAYAEQRCHETTAAETLKWICMMYKAQMPPTAMSNTLDSTTTGVHQLLRKAK